MIYALDSLRLWVKRTQRHIVLPMIEALRKRESCESWLMQARKKQHKMAVPGVLQSRRYMELITDIMTNEEISTLFHGKDPTRMRSLIIRIQKRWERGWLKRFTGPLRVLARACLRIRWESHAHFMTYNLPGLHECIVARLLMACIDHVIRRRKAEQDVGIEKLLSRKESKLLARVISHFGKTEQSPAHVALIQAQIQMCRSQLPVTIPWPVSMPNFTVIPPREDRHRLQVYRSFPEYLLQQPCSKRICWYCSMPSDNRMSKCKKCELARYCSRECQKKSWPEHVNKCPTLEQLKKTYGDILRKSHGDGNTKWTWDDEVALRLFQGRS